MLHLLLDSTHYKDDVGFKKSDLAKVKSLGGLSYLTLHVPHIVYNECVTHSKSIVAAAVNKSFGQIAGLPRQGLHEDEYDLAKAATDAIHGLKEVVEESAGKRWLQFIEESKAILYDLNVTDTQEIFDAYFSAGKPFKSLKCRDDIPDAYIYHQAKTIAENYELIVLSRDKNLRDRLNEIDNLAAYEKWEELYATDAYKEASAKLEENEFVDGKKVLLLAELPDVLEEVKHQISIMENVKFFNDMDDVDERETSIMLFENVDVTVNNDDIEFYGEGFVLPLNITAEVQVEYFMYWGDYVVADFRNLYESEQINRHVMRIVEGWKVKAEIDHLLLFEDINEGEIDITIDEVDKWEIVD